MKSKIELFGNRATMFGCIDDDYNSADTISIVVEENMPNALILGDVSSAHMDYYRLGELRYMNTPSKIQDGFRPENTLAKKKMNQFFQQEIDSSQTIHFETDKMHGNWEMKEEGVEPQSLNDYTVYESD